jgi:hypothetical protein
MDARLGWLAALVTMLAGACASGCTAPLIARPSTSAGKSPLHPIELGSDGAALEVVFIRLPPGPCELAEMLWTEVDEQPLALELRRELSRNGFRAGVLSARTSPALAQLLAGNRPSDAAGEGPTALEAEPTVTRRMLQVRSGRRAEVIASGAHAQWPVLINEAGQLRGRTYTDAQGILAVKAWPLGDGRLRLHVVPELAYGEVRQHWVGEDGVFRLQSGKPRQTFEQLALELTLAPNQMLVLGGATERPGSLGHYFFSESSESGRGDSKLLIVRHAQTRYDDLFGPLINEAEGAAAAPTVPAAGVAR